MISNLKFVRMYEKLRKLSSNALNRDNYNLKTISIIMVIFIIANDLKLF